MIEEVLGNDVAETVLINSFQRTDWKTLMARYPIREKLVRIFKNITIGTGMSIWSNSHESGHSELEHTTTFESTFDVM